MIGLIRFIGSIRSITLIRSIISITLIGLIKLEKSLKRLERIGSISRGHGLKRISDLFTHLFITGCGISATNISKRFLPFLPR